MLPAPTAVEAPIVVVATPVTPAPSPPPAIPVQEVTHVGSKINYENLAGLTNQ